MRRALAALAVTAALVVGAGAAYASGTTASRTMHDRMTQVPAGSMDMSSMDMSSMDMSGTDMDAMHTQMRAAMPADLAARCDEAHAQMTVPSGTAESDPSTHAGHAAHHPAS